MLSRIYPQARFISAPAESSIGELRTFGMKAATGDIVLLLDDASTIDERFIDGVLGRFNTRGAEHAIELDASGARSQQRRESLRVSGES